MKTLNNQSGFAYLLTVVVLSASVFTSLSFAYIYSMNRLRYQTRIKEAYKLLNITESAAKTVKAAWDKDVMANPTFSDDQHATSVNSALAAGVDDGGTCAQACSSAYGINPGDVTMCFANADNSSLPYCFTGGTEVTASYHLVEPKLKWQKVEKFIAKINKFFNGVHATPIEPISFSKPTLLSWIFKAPKAMATYPDGGGQTTCPQGTYMMPVAGYQGVYSCQCPTPGQTFNGSSCVSSNTTQSPPQGEGGSINCSDPNYVSLCTYRKTISANSQANCSATPKPSSCARCVSTDGVGGQNSSCGVVSAKIPGSAEDDAPVTQTFRISKAGDMF
ncbi:MAG: hypothetical protein IPM57_06140 [Oligoflexia bacterium]|nr:hypothetical protein [Oligoflexia bacterium]